MGISAWFRGVKRLFVADPDSDTEEHLQQRRLPPPLPTPTLRTYVNLEVRQFRFNPHAPSTCLVHDYISTAESIAFPEYGCSCQGASNAAENVSVFFFFLVSAPRDAHHLLPLLIQCNPRTIRESLPSSTLGQSHVAPSIQGP